MIRSTALAGLVLSGLLATTAPALASTDHRSVVTGNATHGGRWRLETTDGAARGPWRHDRAVLRLGDGLQVHAQGAATCRTHEYDGFDSGVLGNDGSDDAYCIGWSGEQ